MTGDAKPLGGWILPGHRDQACLYKSTSTLGQLGFLLPHLSENRRCGHLFNQRCSLLQHLQGSCYQS